MASGGDDDICVPGLDKVSKGLPLSHGYPCQEPPRFFWLKLHALATLRDLLRGWLALTQAQAIEVRFLGSSFEQAFVTNLPFLLHGREGPMRPQEASKRPTFLTECFASDLTRQIPVKITSQESGSTDRQEVAGTWQLEMLQRRVDDDV